MSKVKIEGNASGTGTLTIAAPNTNTDRTLTLPDGAGEILTDSYTGDVTITGDVSCTDLSFNSGYGSVATAYGCRAWLLFDAPSPQILGSANISSVTDNGAGNFTVNLSNAMPDDDFAVPANAINSNSSVFSDVRTIGCYPISTTTINVFTHRITDQVTEDPQRISIAVFR